MRPLGKLGCCVAVCGYAWAGLLAQFGVANLGPSGVASAGLPSALLATIQARAQLRGMRVRSVRWDAVLRQNWAVLEDFEHPERPLWSELTDPIGIVLKASSGLSPTVASPPPPPPKPMVMRYGDRVRLWRIERNVRIEMNAMAEGSAGVGDEVKLRIPGSGTNGDGGWQVTGIVRGPGDVEMEP